MTNYYKKITILEGIYLEDKKLFLKKDLSKYFKYTFSYKHKLITELELLKYNYNGKNEEIKGKNFKQLVLFLDRVVLNTRLQHYSLEPLFECKNEGNLIVNARIYQGVGLLKDNIKVIIDDIYKNFIDEIKVDKDEFSLDFFNDEDFNILRMFDFESFFSDHESLFDKDNDFENTKNKKLYHGLKDENQLPIENLETEIKNAKSQNKFYIDIQIPDDKLNSEEYGVSGEEKYDYVFVTERGNYLCYTKNG